MRRLLDKLNWKRSPGRTEARASWVMDPRIEPFLVMAEVHRGDRLVGPLFRKKFGSDPPTFGTHMVAFHRRADASLVLAGYVHFWERDGLGYIGGVCTDDRVVRSMSREERALLQAAGGGVYYHLLSFTFHRYSTELDAFAGYCGDARSLRVSLQAGFRETPHRFLLMRTNNAAAEARWARLVEQAHANGPF